MHTTGQSQPIHRIPPPPGPRGRDAWHSRRRLQQQPLAEYLALQRQYGDVVHLPRSGPPMYLISHPDGVGHVLRDHAENYRKGVLFQGIARLQGQGLLTSDGELWRQQRHLLQPLFQPRQVVQYGAVMQHEAEVVAQAWQQAAHTGKAMQVSAWMARLSFRIVGQTVLGIAPAALDDVARQLQALAAPLRPVLTARTSLWRTLPQALPTPSRRQARRAVAAYQALAQELVETRRQRLQQKPTPPLDALGQLVAAHAAGTHASLTEQQLRDEVITLIGAGTETSALALGWTWYLLARHPGVEQQLHAELDRVLAGRPPTVADLQRLPYSRMILDEALRLYPPAALLPRQANAADVVQGYVVPHNGLLLLSPYVTHRHPDFWPDPEHFRPERFAAAGRAGPHRFAYFPFGAGLRVCLGQAFALQEMHLALATLAQHYTLRLLPEHPVVPVLAPTLQVRGGLWMTVHKRHPDRAAAGRRE